MASWLGGIELNAHTERRALMITSMAALCLEVMSSNITSLFLSTAPKAVISQSRIHRRSDGLERTANHV